MALSRELRVLVTADTSKLQTGLKQTDSALGKTEKQSHKLAGAVKVAGLALAGGLVVGLKSSAQAAERAEVSQKKLETQLRSAGISYKAHAREIDNVIQKTSKLAGLDDEDLQDAFTNIIRVTGDVSKSLKLTGLAADFARAKHIDVAKAGEIVGKVAGGNIGILSRYGIQIRKGATATEALGALQGKFAGQAAAYGKTSAGAADRVAVAWENAQETLGAAVLPILAKLANKLADVLGWMQRNQKATRAIIVALGALAAVLVTVMVVTKVIAALKALRTAMVAVNVALAANPIGIVVIALAALGVALVVAYKKSETFRKIVDGAWQVVKTGATSAANAIKGVVVPAFNAIVTAANKIVSAVKSVISAFNAAKGAVGKVAGFLNPFGDGPGKAPGGIGAGGVLPSGGAFGGSLMGARPAMAPFAAIGSRYGLHVSSGRRPGSITSSGNTSWHSTGEAIDEAGSPAGMLSYFKYLKSRFGGRLAELIYTPGGVGVKNGQPFTYTGQVAADHYDHVHVAFDSGAPGQGDGDGNVVSAFRRAISSARATPVEQLALFEAGIVESGLRNLSYGDRDSVGALQQRPSQGWHGLMDPYKAALEFLSHARGKRPWKGSAGSLAQAVQGSAFPARYDAVAAQARGYVGGGVSRGGGGGSGGKAGGKVGGKGSDTVPFAPDHAYNAPNKRFGMGPQKGVLRPGSDGSDLSSGGDGGGGDQGDPNQPLIDAINAAAEIQKRLDDDIVAMKAEIKRQTDFASSVQSTSNFQLTKTIADLVSGHIIGRGVAGRSFTPGSGVERAY
jgi:hypothetical protein